MFCKYCGNQIPENAECCPSCEKPISDNQASYNKSLKQSLSNTVILKADIKRNKIKKLTIIIFYIIIAMSLIIGLLVGLRYDDMNYPKTDPDYPDSGHYCTNYVLGISWFNVGISFKIESHCGAIGFYDPYAQVFTENASYFFVGNLLALLFAYSFICMVPIVWNKYCNKQAQNTSLELSENYLSGTVYSLGKTQLSFEIPLEKVDNISVCRGIFDRLRTGDTIVITSASQIFKIHYVKNSKQFLEAAKGKIKI